MSREAVIVAAVRSPMGKLGGALSRVRPDDLAAEVIKGLLARAPQLKHDEIDDVYFGCANQAGEDNRNVARMAALLAGLPQSVPGCTVNRLCASGLEAVNSAARCVVAGEGDVYVAGGVESMSRAPWAFPKPDKGFPFGNVTGYDTALGWRFPNPKMSKMFPLLQMGETAENVAQKYGIKREEQDAYALESHRRAAQAQFKEEIVPISAPQAKGEPVIVASDEGPRPDTSTEKLAALKPAFKENGTVTAGNSSGLNDGAAAVLVMEAKKAEKLGIKALVRWVKSASAGLDPSFMGLGPVHATRKLGVKPADLDLIEINEAFAAQVLACARDLEISREKLNVNGGAIALGHPLGCSGARLVVTLTHEMLRRRAKRGLASLCVGVGQGLSTLFERI